MIEQGTGQPTDDRTEPRQGDRLQGVSYLWIGVMAIGFLVLLAAVVLAVASALIPFHQTVRVPVVRAGTDMA